MMCMTCKKGYENTIIKFTCKKCPIHEINVIRLVAITILTTLTFVYLSD